MGKDTICNSCKRRYKVVITDDDQPEEHVGGQQDVDDHPSLLPNPHVEYGVWKLTDSWLNAEAIGCVVWWD